MKKTIVETFENFSKFYQELKPRFVADFKDKDLINNIFFSHKIYDYYKYDIFYGSPEEAFNRIFTQIVLDCAEFSKKEAIYGKIYEKIEEILNYEQKTQERKQIISQTDINNPGKEVITETNPVNPQLNFLGNSFGKHSEILRTIQKTKEGRNIIKTDEGIIQEGKYTPNWSKIYLQDNAGLAKVLAAFQYIEIDLTKYLKRYRKFFYSSYGLDGFITQDSTIKRYIFKPYEKLIGEEKKPTELPKKVSKESSKKKAVSLEGLELSYKDWKENFRQENPDKIPNFNLYTVYRLERNKAELEKQLKETSGSFKDKVNLRLNYTEDLIAAYSKEIRMPSLGKPSEKLSWNASEEQEERASFWAKINRVVGFTEFKKTFANFVENYNYLVEDGLKDETPSQMYLLLGPPGVGKSYIATMLSKATNRPIEIISLNGKQDASVFFGSPQVYGAAETGEILKAIMRHKDRALIILLDEFEKCEKNVQQVLGNITDKTMNKKFKDVFYDFPIPINEIIFFCTANYAGQIEPFIFSRLTPVSIEPPTYFERIETAQDLIILNFKRYKISELARKFNMKLIKKCFTKEWGVRGLKDNIELPLDWNTFDWPIIPKDEIDAGCPYSKNKENEHKKDCECFKEELIEGWLENIQKTDELDDSEEIIPEIKPIKLPGAFPDTFPLEKLTKKDKQKIEKWTNIHPNCQDIKLIKSWEDKRFSLDEAREWFNIGFKPDEANFVQWIRDIKLKNYQVKKNNNQSKTEYVINKLNKDTLRKEFEKYNAK